MPLQRGEILGYDFNRMVVEFTMLNQGETVRCAISTAAMDDLEGKRGVKADQRVDQFVRLPIGGGPDMLAAFSQGKIGGFSLSPPTITTAEKSGGFVLLDLAKGEYAPLNGYLFTAMIAQDGWLASHRETAEKLVRALWRGEQGLRSEPDQSREAVRTFFSRTDPAIFDAAWTASLPSYPLTPRIEAAGVDKNITFMNAVEVEPVRIAADQVFTNAIVDAVAPHMSRKAVAPHMSRN